MPRNRRSDPAGHAIDRPNNAFPVLAVASCVPQSLSSLEITTHHQVP